MALESREDRNIQGQLDIFTSVVLELGLKRIRSRAASRISEIGRGPSGIGTERREQLPSGGVKFPFCIHEVEPCDTGCRIIALRKVHHVFHRKGIGQNPLAVNGSRKGRVDDKFLWLRPEHHVLKGDAGIVELVVGLNELVLLVCKVGIHLDDIGMAFLSEFLLTACFRKGLLGNLDLRLVDVRQLAVIKHVAVGFHRGETDVSLDLVFLRVAKSDGSLGDPQVVNGLESVEESDAGADTIAVVERCCGDVSVGLRVNGTSEIVVGRAASADLWSEGIEDRVPSCKPGVIVGRLLDPHLGAVADRIPHAILKRHRSRKRLPIPRDRPLGHRCGKRRNGKRRNDTKQNRQRNEYCL